MQSRLDLNLIVALDVLLEEGSVGGAARRLHLSEPAMSRTLGRIRKALGDPVLVRAGRTMVPTPRALALRTEAHALVQRAEALFGPPEELDLALLSRTFIILSADSALSVGPELLDRVRRDAPAVTLRFLGEDPDSEATRLRDGNIDLDIGVIHPGPPEIQVEPLATDHMTPVVRVGHPLTRGRLTLRRFAAADHISASRRGRTTGPVDDALAEHGLRRQVTAVVPTYAAAVTMVSRTDLVGLMPARLGCATAAAFGLVLLDVPLNLPPLELAQAWHPRYDSDGAHRWLRQCVREAVHGVMERAEAVLAATS